MEQAVEQLAAMVQQQQQQILQLTQQLSAAPTAPRSHDKAAKPERFQGSSSDLHKAADWLFQTELCFDAGGVPAEQRVALAATYLADHALRWWRSIAEQERPTTWESFKALFRRQFVPDSVALGARERLARYAQRRSVRDYTAGFRQLILQVPDLSAAEALDRYKRGLKPNVRMLVELAAPDTWETAAVKAESIDNITYLNRQPTSPYRPAARSGPAPMEIGALRQFPGPTDPRGRSDAKPHPRPPARDHQRRQEDIDKRLCFYCHQPGHVALACPELGRQNRREGNGRRQ